MTFSFFYACCLNEQIQNGKKKKETAGFTNYDLGFTI